MSQEPNALNDDELKDVSGGWIITPPALNPTYSVRVEGLENRARLALDGTDPEGEVEEFR